MNDTGTSTWRQDPRIQFALGYGIGFAAEYFISIVALPLPLRWLTQVSTYVVLAALLAIAGAAAVWGGSVYARRRIGGRRALRAITTATLALLLGFSLVQTGGLFFFSHQLSSAGTFGHELYVVVRLISWAVPIGVAVWLYRVALANESRAPALDSASTPDPRSDAVRRFFANLLIAIGILMLLVAGACAVVLGVMDDSLLPTIAIFSGATAIIAAAPILLGRWLRRGTSASESQPPDRP